MTEEILINVTPQETRVAVTGSGVVQELLIERSASRGLVGNIYMGRVARVLPGMQSALHNAPGRPVVEWMSKDPTTTDPGADVKDALRTMVDGGFRHLPVIDGGDVVGMVSIRDVAGAMAD